MKVALFWLIACAMVVVPVSGIAQGGVAGEWNMTINSDQGPLPMGLTLALDGDALSGNLSSDMLGSSELAGTFADDMLSFTSDMDAQGQTFTLTFTGALDGEAMTGNVDFGGFGSADFTAERK